MVVTTNQAAVLANVYIGLSLGGGDRRWNHAFARIELPVLPAVPTAADLLIYGAGSGYNLVDVACDVVATSWSEASDVATMETVLSQFGTYLVEDQAASGVLNTESVINVFGDLTKGIRKVYTDSLSPNPVSVLLSYPLRAGVDALIETGLKLGLLEDADPDDYEYQPRTNATYYPRIRLTYAGLKGAGHHYKMLRNQ